MAADVLVPNKCQIIINHYDSTMTGYGHIAGLVVNYGISNTFVLEIP